MSDALRIAVCGLAGMLVGAALPVVIERVPERRALRGPFPEPARALRKPTGVLVVLVTAGLFGALATQLDDTWALPAYLVLAAALVALTVIDLRLFILPNRIVFPLAGAGVVMLGAAAALDGNGDAFARALLGAVVGFVAFLALHLLVPSGMGFGDVKLSFSLGLFLGWIGWGQLGLGFFLAFVYGAVVGIALMLFRGKGRKDRVPFGPFLAAGTLTAILVGQTIIDWYRG